MIFSKLNPYALQRHAGRGTGTAGTSGAGAGTGAGGGGAGAPAGTFLLDTFSSGALEDLENHVGEIGAEWTLNEPTVGAIVEDGLLAIGGDVPGVYAFAEEFETLPTGGVPPSGGPETFASSSTRMVVDAGVVYPTSPTLTGTSTFTGSEFDTTTGTRVYRIGARFDSGDVGGSGVRVNFRFSEAVVDGYAPDVVAGGEFECTFFSNSSTSLFFNCSESDNSGPEPVLLAYAEVTSAPTIDVWSAGAGITQEIRLEVAQADGIKAYVSGVLVASASWSEGSMDRPLDLRYVRILLQRPGAGVDYVRCDEELV